MKYLTFKRIFAQSFITSGRPPKVGWPLFSATTPTTSKRRNSSYSVLPRIRKENLGVLWPKYNHRRRHYEFCANSS